MGKRYSGKGRTDRSSTTKGGSPDRENLTKIEKITKNQPRPPFCFWGELPPPHGAGESLASSVYATTLTLLFFKRYLITTLTHASCLGNSFGTPALEPPPFVSPRTSQVSSTLNPELQTPNNSNQTPNKCTPPPC